MGWSNKTKVIVGLCVFALLSLIGLAAYWWWYLGDSTVVMYQVNNGTHITTIEKIVHNRDMAWAGVCGYIIWECICAIIIMMAVLLSIDWDDVDRW